MNKTEFYRLPNLHKLNRWKSPEKEQSVFSGIPILHLNSVKGVVSDALKDSGFAYNIRFQGPRFDPHKMTTKKEDATHFRVYVKKQPAKASLPKKQRPEFLVVNGCKYRLVK